jgi:hypothetical protein
LKTFLALHLDLLSILKPTIILASMLSILLMKGYGLYLTGIHDEIEKRMGMVHGIEDYHVQDDDCNDDTNVPSSAIIHNQLGIIISEAVYQREHWFVSSVSEIRIM